MPTNRLAEKEKVLTYASVLLDGALAEGGQAAAMAIRDRADEIVRIMRANPALTEALKNNAYTVELKGEVSMRERRMDEELRAYAQRRNEN